MLHSSGVMRSNTVQANVWAYARLAAVATVVSLALAPLAFAEDKPANPAAAAAPAKPAEPAPPTEASKDAIKITTLYVHQLRDKPLPLSMLDLPAADEGIAGAKLAIADNNTTGKFLNQSFKLEIIESADVDDLIKQTLDKFASGDSYIVADMDAAALLKFADALAGKQALIANVGNADDSLREENCRANVIHIPPTRTMLADALGQYLVWKKWSNWFLVSGPRPEDKLMADAYRRTAKRFGAKIIDEKEFNYDPGNRRADGGFEQVQSQIPQFMQSAKEHDVVIVADEGQLFGDYVPYRTWIARPVAGTTGLTATSWHPALELWGGTQFQHRFRKLNNRIMSPIDYDAWLAVRVIGEASSRKKPADFKDLNAYIHSKEFEVAAFKGVATSLRAWNGQLRQPLIVGTPKLLVTISPQPGFLHQFNELDTLGIDKPETKCKAYTQSAN